MKIGSAVFGLHIAVLCVFSLTQGCLTTGSDTPGRGARHKGPFQHEHKGKTSVAAVSAQPSAMDYGTGLDGEPVFTSDPVMVTPIEPTAVSMAPTTATESYIVRKGDTLSQLAVDFDTTTAELVRINGLPNPDVLYVGQELRVPAGRRGTSSPSSSSSKPAVQKGGTYVIQKGDTLSEIALAAGVSIDSLRQLNHIEGDKIMAGETLDIPAGGKIPPAKTPKTATKTTAPKTEPKVESTAPAATELAVPDIAAADEAAAPEGTAPASFDVVEERIYYPGESLDDIAREYGVSKAEIMRLNGITDETQIRDGQRLRIPIAE